MEQQQQQQQEVLRSRRYKTRLGKEEAISRPFVDQVEPMSSDQCQTLPKVDDPELAGAPMTVSESDGGVVVPSARNLEENVKPRRGRPPKLLGKITQQRCPVKKKDEEDVCFICFDGGTLVLCDRRDCPKAYHPSCVKRDESFFRSKAKWNCGWHICSICQKASHFMCYTCTFSLCNGCTKDADYLTVRGNKGFCGACLKTVLLIEKISIGDEENKEMVQVDFDDKSSWEYLFKMYWIYLKEKVSLTLGELMKAKSPWKAVTSMPCKAEPLDGTFNGNDENISSVDKLCGQPEANKSKKRKTENQQVHFNKDFGKLENSVSDQVKPLPEATTPWASKELLEFISFTKNGDTSVLSQSNVQALLLEYIRKNVLRNPLRKCQVICDSRLITLFGKERVDHFEMVKLLECHFLVKENIPRVVDQIPAQIEVSGSNDSQLTINSEKKLKKCPNNDERGLQNNPNEYAAIDAHNINLLYLKSSLVANLMDDAECFHNKVVGSFVLLRIPSGKPKQDIYRIVQVVGTSKVAESYKVGTRTTNFMLEILNLGKKEVISVKGISNQEISEDECKQLRQSIKDGFMKPLTVGEIQEKTNALRAVKFNDWLEAEAVKLSQLREKGHMKELRECVEKLQLLKSPEERQRILNGTPEVHVDHTMDPSYESVEDDSGLDAKKQDPAVRHLPIEHSLKGLDSSKDKESRSNQHRSSQTASQTSASLTSTKPANSEIYSTQASASGPGVKLLSVDSSSNCSGSPTSISLPVTKAANSEIYSSQASGPSVKLPSVNSSSNSSVSQTSISASTSTKPASSEIYTRLASGLSTKLPSADNSSSCSASQTSISFTKTEQANRGQAPGVSVKLPSVPDSSSCLASQTSTSFTNRKPANNEIYSGQASGLSMKHPSVANSSNCSASQTSISAFTNTKPTNSEVYTNQTSGLSVKPPSASSSSNCSILGSNIVSLTMSLETPPPKQEMHLPGQQNFTSKHVQQVSEFRHTENKHSTQLNLPVLDLGRNSQAPARLIEDWDLNLVSPSSFGPVEVVHMADAPSWQAIAPEPTEFCSLPDESVSDLLAEVEAMEALGRLGSLTSIISGELRGSENDCFSPVDGFSPIHMSGKNDGDIQMPCRVTVKDEPHEVVRTLFPAGNLQMHSRSTVTSDLLGVSQFDIFGPQENRDRYFSSAAEVKVDQKGRNKVMFCNPNWMQLGK